MLTNRTRKITISPKLPPELLLNLGKSLENFSRSYALDERHNPSYAICWYYDPNRNEWWALSDRGPGGGLMSYDTRVQRFTLDVDMGTGAISNFMAKQLFVVSRSQDMRAPVAGLNKISNWVPLPF